MAVQKFELAEGAGQSEGGRPPLVFHRRSLEC